MESPAPFAAVQSYGESAVNYVLQVWCITGSILSLVLALLLVHRVVSVAVVVAVVSVAVVVAVVRVVVIVLHDNLHSGNCS